MKLSELDILQHEVNGRTMAFVHICVILKFTHALIIIYEGKDVSVLAANRVSTTMTVSQIVIGVVSGTEA